jgi:hypothetical protein
MCKHTVASILYYSSKIKFLTENRMNELNIQPTTHDETTTTSMSAGKEMIACDIDGCKKQFMNANALKDHQSAKHPNIQLIVYDETTTMAKKKKPKKATTKQKISCDSDGCNQTFRNENALENHRAAKHPLTPTSIHDETTTFEKAAKKQAKECGIDSCKQSYRKLRALQLHQIETHPIPLRCPFSKECLESNEKYLGILYLQNHITREHAEIFSHSICPIYGCKSSKYWQDWSAALHHILQRHANYLLT